MKFNINDHLERIAAVFKGMDEEYIKIVQGFHSFFTDETRTEEAKRGEHARTKNAIRDLRRDRVAAAKAVIDAIREEATPKPGGDNDQDQATRQANIQLWTAILPTATVDELRDLYLRHGGNDDFMALLNVQFRTRDKDDLQLQTFISEIESGPEIIGIEDLSRVEHSINSMGSENLTQWPQGMDEAILTNLANVKFRSIDADLKSFPVEDGAAYRGIFKMGPQ